MAELADTLVKPLTLEQLRVPIDTLHPNPWNPNEQDERTYEAERESIRLYGFIDPVTVRPHPDAKGIWQIIDGEHRWRAAIDEGYTETLINNLGPIDDIAAKKLTIIFNETRGEANVAKMGKLIHELAEATGRDMDVLLTALPYSVAEANQLIEIGKTDWDSWADAAGTPEPRGRGGTEAVDPTLREYPIPCTDEQFDEIGRLLGMLTREHDTSDADEVVAALKEKAKGL